MVLPKALKTIGRGLPLNRRSLIVCALLFTFPVFSSCTKKKPEAPRTVPVTVVTVTQRDVPVQIRAIGNVEPINAVSIKALIGGEMVGAYFKEGQDVRKGEILFKIDPRPYEASLRQAEANLARDEAQAKNAEEDAKRYAILAQKDYVPISQYDQFRANAEALAALVTADKAQVENSRLQLEYCTIRSPIDGRVGSILINVGNVVKANDLSLATINQMVPIYVTFSVPEQHLAEIKTYMVSEKLQVRAIIPGEEQNPVQGVLTFIDNAVDSTTGTIQLKGTFENRDKRLWPGQFVNVVLTLTTRSNAIVIPFQAVQTGQDGLFVFVVKSDLTVEPRPVAVEQTSNNEAVVSKGLTPGETVVTDGQLQLFPGANVEIKSKAAESQVEGDLRSPAPGTSR